MTSLYDRIQTLGNRMATNLQKMGVSASFSDGGLTLADKILEINRFTDGIFISSDKSIDQSSNTINFTAVYMADGNVVSGKSVNFYGLKAASGTSKNLTGNTYNAVGCKYIFTTNPFGTVYLDREGNVRLFSSGSSASSPLTLYVDDESVAVGTYGSSSISVEDGYITFDNTVVDCREYDLSVIRPFSNYNGGVISDFGVFDTTDDNGVATATYTCTGAGKQTVKAISGSVVSLPCEVIDALFLDTHTNHNTKWWLSQSSASVSVDTDGIIFSSENVASTAYSRNLTYITNSFPEGWSEKENVCKFLTSTFCLEFDIVDVLNSDRVIVNFVDITKHIGNISNGDHIKIEFNGSQLIIYKNSIHYDTLSVSFDKTWVGFNVFGGYKIKLDNISVYPI